MSSEQDEGGLKSEEVKQGAGVHEVLWSRKCFRGIRRRRRRRRCLLPSGNWRGKNNALSGYDGTDQPQTSGERTPAAKSCPTVSSPLPLNPLEIYCHALSRRPPCRRVEMSLYEKGPVTADSTGGGGVYYQVFIAWRGEDEIQSSIDR